MPTSEGAKLPPKPSRYCKATVSRPATWYSLPGEDPDSLFRRLGRQSFRAIIRESQLTDQIQSTTPKSESHQHAVQSDNQHSHLVESDTSLNTPDSIMGSKEAVGQGQGSLTEAPEEFGTLISDRPDWKPAKPSSANK